jgi:hypothetical protein
VRLCSDLLPRHTPPLLRAPRLHRLWDRAVASPPLPPT